MKNKIKKLTCLLIILFLVLVSVLALSSGRDYSIQRISFRDIPACEEEVADKQKIEESLLKTQTDIAEYLKKEGFKNADVKDVVHWEQGNKVNYWSMYKENIKIYEKNGLNPVLVVMHVGIDGDVCESGLDILWDGNYFLSRVRNDTVRREQFYNELKSWWGEYKRENLI